MFLFVCFTLPLCTDKQFQTLAIIALPSSAYTPSGLLHKINWKKNCCKEFKYFWIVPGSLISSIFHNHSFFTRECLNILLILNSVRVIVLIIANFWQQQSLTQLSLLFLLLTLSRHHLILSWQLHRSAVHKIRFCMVGALLCGRSI